jgi:hypothetical protein
MVALHGLPFQAKFHQARDGTSLSTMIRWRRSSMRKARLEAVLSTTCNPL